MHEQASNSLSTLRCEKAEPGARANVPARHASCWRTSRAEQCRGSSLTLARKNFDSMRSFEVMREREKGAKSRANPLSDSNFLKEGASVVSPSIRISLLKKSYSMRKLLPRRKNPMVITSDSLIAFPALGARANQALEPTPLLVMPRAGARVTPIRAVAHL